MSLGKSCKDLEFNFGFSFARLILFLLRHVINPHYAYLKSKFVRNIETFLFFTNSDTILVGNQILLIAKYRVLYYGNSFLYVLKMEVLKLRQGSIISFTFCNIHARWT